MFGITNTWNLVCPEKYSKDAVASIKLRGYNKETFLTGEFARKISHEDLRPLSVSNIADKYCCTRRDLYFYKGVARSTTEQDRSQEFWGGKAGYVVEEYIKSILEYGNNDASCKYTSLIKNGNDLYAGFIKSRSKSLNGLKCLEDSALHVKEGDTDWLLEMLRNNGRVELSARILHSMLEESNSLDTSHIRIKQEIEPKIIEIGMNSPATPDFIAPEFSMIGDIKTGVKFEPHYQLTCAGYALAYENWKGTNVNWGMIYFFPTRLPACYVKPITFAQIYIFPLDDYLRQWFLDTRDEAYNIISRGNLPDFPPSSRMDRCYDCRFRNQCVSQGLELSVDA